MIVLAVSTCRQQGNLPGVVEGIDFLMTGRESRVAEQLKRRVDGCNSYFTMWCIDENGREKLLVIFVSNKENPPEIQCALFTGIN